MTSPRPCFDFRIPVEPTPASRPKIGKYGTHYSKAHTAYKQACLKFLESVELDHEPILVGNLQVTLVFVCTKARTSKLITPRYDIDNLAKLPLDCMTSSGRFWKDDVQIDELLGVKLFAGPNYPAGTHVTIQKNERST